MKGLTLFLLPGLLSAAAVFSDDSDFDGVEDRFDRCPDTPFELTVDADGCPDEPLPSTPELFVSASVGITWSTGKYGGDDTVESLSNEAVLALYTGRFNASVTGAYYYRGAYDPTVATYDGGGIADTLLTAGWLLSVSDRFDLSAGVHLKLPTAADGLGTGEADYGVSLRGTCSADGVQAFAAAGYTVTGDGETDYRDIVFGSIGSGFRLDSRSYGSVSIDYSQAYSRDTEDLWSLSLYGSYDLYTTLTLRLNYSIGLSDSVADHLVSAMLTHYF